ncbi:MAG: pilus motility taxis protein HmpF [Leptolyngbyaceae cyanobacterium MAG.088]|nr:pilus motility taxis protein HmpF [Leptolyngbyaceae cyanobacterium MAG.088]
MRYLAEVQRKSGFMGGSRAEFKLLACERSEQNWSAVSGDELVPAPDDAGYSAGALILIELSNGRQVQRHYEAGRQLVSILQNFSSLNKKFKTQEEEIEQWKESLTYQSQALNQRELELDTREDEVKQASDELTQLEAQRQELDALRSDLDNQRQDYERRNSELEGAWAHLNGEKQKLEEHREVVSAQVGLDSDQTQKLRDAVERLMANVVPMEDLRQQLGTTRDVLGEHQGALQGWQQSGDQQGEQLQTKGQDVERFRQSVQQLYETTAAEQKVLRDLCVELQQAKVELTQKKQQNQLVSEQINQQSGVYQRVYDLLNTGDKVRLGKKIDLTKLEDMSLDDLEALLAGMETDLEKMSRFVSDQEEELTYQQQAIDELKQKAEAASEYDRLQIEADIGDEQDRYDMLNKTLVGQRRTLLEREEVLSQHQAVLLRRKGQATVDSPVENAADLEPVLEHIDQVRQDLSNQTASLEQLIAELEERCNVLQQQVDTKQEELAQQVANLEQERTTLEQALKDWSGLEGAIATRNEHLGPASEKMDAVQQMLDNVFATLERFQEVNDYQLQAIAEMQQTIQSLSSEPAAA